MFVNLRCPQGMEYHAKTLVKTSLEHLPFQSPEPMQQICVEHKAPPLHDTSNEKVALILQSLSDLASLPPDHCSMASQQAAIHEDGAG